MCTHKCEREREKRKWQKKKKKKPCHAIVINAMINAMISTHRIALIVFDIARMMVDDLSHGPGPFRESCSWVGPHRVKVDVDRRAEFDPGKADETCQTVETVVRVTFPVHANDCKSR